MLIYADVRPLHPGTAATLVGAAGAGIGVRVGADVGVGAAATLKEGQLAEIFPTGVP